MDQGRNVQVMHDDTMRERLIVDQSLVTFQFLAPAFRSASTNRRSTRAFAHPTIAYWSRTQRSSTSDRQPLRELPSDGAGVGKFPTRGRNPQGRRRVRARHAHGASEALEHAQQIRDFLPVRGFTPQRLLSPNHTQPRNPALSQALVTVGYSQKATTNIRTFGLPGGSKPVIKSAAICVVLQYARAPHDMDSPNSKRQGKTTPRMSTAGLTRCDPWTKRWFLWPQIFDRPNALRPRLAMRWSRESGSHIRPATTMSGAVPPGPLVQQVGCVQIALRREAAMCGAMDSVGEPGGDVRDYAALDVGRPGQTQRPE